SSVCAPTASADFSFFLVLLRPPPTSTLFPYTTLFRSAWPCPRVRVRGGSLCGREGRRRGGGRRRGHPQRKPRRKPPAKPSLRMRSEEHTSELQSRRDLVCRLLLEKKKKKEKAKIKANQ